MATTRSQENRMVLRSKANSNTKHFILENLKNEISSKSEKDKDNLLNNTVVKYFDGEAYNGKIVSYRKPYYLVEYDDGDREEYTKNAVHNLLIMDKPFHDLNIVTEDEGEEMSICSDITEIEEIEGYQERFDIQNKSENSMYFYDVDIDFDEAHNSWVENKIKGENGTYYYSCGKVMKNGKKCTHAQRDKSGLYSGCKRHYAWEEKENKYL